LDAVESYNEQWLELWQAQERGKLAEAESKVRPRQRDTMAVRRTDRQTDLI
jgi:hypothetical protein